MKKIQIVKKEGENKFIFKIASFVCLKIDDNVERILRNMIYSNEFGKVIEDIFKYKYPNRIIFNNSCDHIFGMK